MHIPVFVWYHDSSWMLLVVHTVMALSPYLTTNTVQSTMRRSQVVLFRAWLVVPGFPERWACIHDTHGFALFVGYVYPKNYSWLKKMMNKHGIFGYQEATRGFAWNLAWNLAAHQLICSAHIFILATAVETTQNWTTALLSDTFSLHMNGKRIDSPSDWLLLVQPLSFCATLHDISAWLLLAVIYTFMLLCPFPIVCPLFNFRLSIKHFPSFVVPHCCCCCLLLLL